MGAKKSKLGLPWVDNRLKLWMEDRLLNEKDSVKDLLPPVIFEICQRTTNPEEFAVALKELGVLTPHEQEHCLSHRTNMEKNDALYSIIIKKNSGKELILALDKCRQDHVFRIIFDGHPDKHGTPSRDTSVPSTTHNSLLPQINQRVPSADSSFFEWTSDRPLVSISTRTSYISDLGRDDLIPYQIAGQDEAGQRKDLKERLSVLLDTVIPRRVIIHGYRFKIKSLLRFLDPFKGTLEHLELNNVVVVQRSKSMFTQGTLQQIDMFKLKTFILDQSDDDMDFFRGIEPILASILHMTRDQLTKYPSLWSITRCPVVDIKRNGETVLSIVKLEGQEQLVLRNYTFLDSNPFLRDVMSTDLKKLTGFGLHLLLDTSIPPRVQEMNLNSCIFEVCTGSFTDALLEFSNLRKLTIDCHLHPLKDFSLDIRIVSMDSLQDLILRSVTLTGSVTDELCEIVKKKNKFSSTFYQCQLDGLTGISSTGVNRDDPVLVWRKSDNDDSLDDLVWSSEMAYSEEYEFHLFHLSEFCTLEAWKNMQK